MSILKKGDLTKSFKEREQRKDGYTLVKPLINTLDLLELLTEPKRSLTFVTLLWKGGALILIKPRTINISIYTRNRCDGDKECNINICQIPPALDSPLLSLHSPVCPAVNLPLKVILDSTWTQLTDPAAHPFLNWPLVQSHNGNFASGFEYHDLCRRISFLLRLFRKVIWILRRFTMAAAN